MIEIITHEGAIKLDLSPNTVLTFEDNSKGFDSNSFVFDYTNNFNLPYSPSNVKVFNRHGYEKFKVIIKSDGIFIGNFFAKFTEDNVNLNTYTGNYVLDIFSVFKDLNELASNTKLNDAFTYSDYINGNLVDDDDLLDPSEPKLHAALRIMQSNPNLDKPYRFPEYHLVKNIQDTNGNPFAPDFYNTIENDFGNEVNVNHLNNTYHANPPLYTNATWPVGVVTQDRKDDWEINYLVLCDRNGIRPRLITPGLPHSTIRAARRIWGIVCPTFNYLEVLKSSLSFLGFRVRFDFLNAGAEKLFTNLYLLNNYNIYDVYIEREEGLFEYNGDVFPKDPFVNQQNLTIYPDVLIQGRNHVPDITVLDLLVDFLVKSNSVVYIEGDTIIFKSISIKQSEVDADFNPNIKTIKYEYLEDKVLKYNYTQTENLDNITDYKLTALQKNTTEISSDIVPVHTRTLIENVGTGSKSFYPYIIGSPSFNTNLSKSKISYTIWMWDMPAGINNGKKADPDKVDTDNLPSYALFPCPLYCSTVHYFDNLGVSLWHRYYPRPVGFFFYYVCIADEEWREIDVIRSLRWEGDKGIFENQYKPTLLILMAKLISYVKAKASIELFNKFSHYHYHPINGKRGFPLGRKYKLPFSANNEIELDFYIVD
jgi:hypothetical protein